MSSDNKRDLTVQETADIFGVSYLTVLRWLYGGALVGYKIGINPDSPRAQWRIPREIVEEMRSREALQRAERLEAYQRRYPRKRKKKAKKK